MDSKKVAPFCETAVILSLSAFHKPEKQ